MKNKQQTLAVAVSFVFALFLSPHLGAQELDDTVLVGRHSVPVRERLCQPVVGVEVEKLLRGAIPTFDDFRLDVGGYPWSGCAFQLRIPRERRGGNVDHRIVYLIVGVFRDHRAALNGTNSFARTLQALAPPPVLLDNEPGYVSWHYPAVSHQRMFVRDNVHVTVQVGKALDLQAIAQGIDDALRNGGVGVLKGDRVQPPVFVQDALQARYSVRAKEKTPAGTLRVVDPTGRKIVRRYVGAACPDLPPFAFNLRYPYLQPPKVSWLDEDSDELQFELERGSVKAVLTAVAHNDLCVVSDIWTKTVEISAREE